MNQFDKNWFLTGLFYNFQLTGLKFTKLVFTSIQIWQKLVQILTFFVFEIPKGKIILETLFYKSFLF